ncbi:MAG: 4-deoxy-4-formamido-L-arabinose-phosphoundecaprenol deformylase [Desulfobacteraceae bacterium IS3]|nr:MAG: 4-deoxy-4-formamido-L-arabinose-phosphoundecaprenol deformylase [Desulfobacteraceae bacterium IS3]
MTKLGLRIDVDTFRGTRHGVPNLCKLLAEHGIKASFFFSVGPDNMGRHLRRLIRPDFLRKMLRSKASSLYGWDIVFKGTLWPGPVIGKKLAHVISAASDSGHEIGFHAWDHHAWQENIDRMDKDAVRDAISAGVEMLTGITGHPPVCSAAPAWKCNDLVLLEKEKFPFRYNSDCRGESIFYPLVAGKRLSQPQIPVTLPTYDEVIGQNGVSERNYNDYQLSLIRPDRLNVLTVHAEAEGIACFSMFKDFVKKAQSQGICFVPLGALLADVSCFGQSAIVKKEFPGREGWVSCQHIV